MAPLIRLGVSIGVLGLAAASLFGWGTAVRRLARMADGTWPVTIGLGLSALLMLGGIVNVARLAFAWTLWGLAAAGLAFAIFDLSRSRRFSFIGQGWGSSEWIEAGSAGAFVLLATGFAIVTQLPPRVFHYVDDLQKYFAHPVRELETGTLFGSPLSALGSETLGGIAFLHSFVLSVAPIEFINGVDAVFGFSLLMCLGAVAGWRRMTPLPGALVAPLVIAAIDPQYMNVSALFLGAALMATTVLLTVHEHEGDPPSALAVGLVYGGLVALKPTFALFVALHLPLVAIALSFVHGARAGFRWALRTAVFAALALSPWVVLHLPHYLDTSSPRIWGAVLREHIGLSLRYTNLIALTLMAASWAVFVRIRDRSKVDLTRIASLLAAAIAVAMAYAIIVLLSPVWAGDETGLRYSTPFLLGTVPLIGVLSPSKSSFRPKWLALGLPLAGYLLAIVPFVPSMLQRYQQAWEYHSIYESGVVRVPQYIQYNRAALSAGSADTVRKLQDLIPPGEPLLAWISQPYDLDFRRNPIVDADPPGMAAYWAHLPPTVRYVLWERQGYGILSVHDLENWETSEGWHERLIAARTLSFIRSLSAELRTAKIIYADDRFVVAILRPGARVHA